jgi:alkaline phosphatase D
MSGDVSTDGAIVWTRFIGRGDLVLSVRDTGSDRYVQHDVPVGPDGFTSVDLSGLSPHRTYRYAFLVREAGRLVRRGPSGRFRTAPEPDALVPVTFAGTSCTNQFIRPYPALAHAASRRDLDFFIHAGDHVYVDWARSLAEIRERYALAWPSWGMKGLHASTSLYATWDDHEVGNNWNPENWSPAMLTAARRSFFEHHPIRRDAARPNRIWRSFKWGRTAEVFVLDSRGERVPSTRERANATYLSRAQMDWLKGGLAHSDARFKFVVNSVPITSFHGVYDLLRSDRWEGYPAARHEILDHIVREHIDGVWWLSGDFHFGSISRVDRDGPYARMREVLMGPGRQHLNPFWGWNEGSQFEFLTPANNYVAFRCDPLRNEVEITFVGPEGETLVRRVY